jgi:signal transduction histidine kinase/ABC-type uncharacterized transport system substrate-binding protein
MRARRFAFTVTWVRAALLVLAIAALCATSVAAQGAQESKRVLILFTHQSDQPGQAIIEQAMRSTLQARSSVQIEIYSEYLDAVRTPLDVYAKDLVGQLQRKYGGKNFDLIFAVNPPALKLLMKNRAALSPGTPIVFLVLGQENLNGLDVGPNMTGVWGEVNVKSNLELALAMHPGTKQVVVIYGVGEWDTYWRSLAQEELPAFEGRVEFSYLTGLTISELKKALAALPPRTIVLFISSTQDNAGNNPGNLVVVRQICPASSAPVYGSSDAQLGLGIVGGRLISFEALGIEGAQVGLRVLSGEKAEAIAPHGIPSVPMFDWRELKRWGVGEQRLPPGSIVRFKELTFWERYKGRIIGAFTLIVLQAALIAVLLIERRRRQRAKLALDQLNAELEERIAARTAALDNKSRALETFAYSVAHDLKAPLRGINGYSRVLVEDYSRDLANEARSVIKSIQTSSEEMSQLIDDLLDYSRLELREFKPDRLELHPLITRLVEQKRREAAERSIDFVVNVDGDTVVADADSLNQSLRNYLDNAVKFTCQTPQPRIEVGSKETATSCLLWVRDNGIGFDSQYRDKIFGIFQRLNPAEEYPGTGIGLAIVGKAMERMGGRAWAESEPGRGATFYLEIPKMNQNEVDS